MMCEYCSLKCIASGCECICHKDKEELNEAEEFHLMIMGVKRRFHLDSFMGNLWLKWSKDMKEINKQGGIKKWEKQK